MACKILCLHCTICVDRTVYYLFFATSLQRDGALLKEDELKKAFDEHPTFEQCDEHANTLAFGAGMDIQMFEA